MTRRFRRSLSQPSSTYRTRRAAYLRRRSMWVDSLHLTMTIVPSLFGAEYDTAASYPVGLDRPQSKFDIATAVAGRLKSTADADPHALDVAYWEVALLRFSLVLGDDHKYAGRTYEQFAAAYGVTEATVAHAEARLAETS